MCSKFGAFVRPVNIGLMVKKYAKERDYIVIGHNLLG